MELNPLNVFTSKADRPAPLTCQHALDMVSMHDTTCSHIHTCMMTHVLTSHVENLTADIAICPHSRIVLNHKTTRAPLTTLLSGQTRRVRVVRAGPGAGAAASGRRRNVHESRLVH